MSPKNICISALIQTRTFHNTEDHSDSYEYASNGGVLLIPELGRQKYVDLLCSKTAWTMKQVLG